MINEEYPLVKFLEELSYTDVHIYNNKEVVNEWLEYSFKLEDLYETFKKIVVSLRYYPERVEEMTVEFLGDYLKEVKNVPENKIPEMINSLKTIYGV